MLSTYHTPALAAESLELLSINRDGIYIDLTFGGGGHSRLILEKLGRKGHLYSFDQDGDAAREAEKITDERFTFIPSNFRWVRGQMRYLGVEQVDGIFADLGVSSHHFDTPERGFSFRFDSELDMRMNARGGRSAGDVINDYPVEELRRIFRDFGELKDAHKIAITIEKTRQSKRIDKVSELVKIVEPYTPRKDASRFLSQLFQALRIEVNGEMEALAMALEQSLRLLKTGGRLVVISYHSLEDRAVKNFLRTGNIRGEMERDMIYGGTNSPFSLITTKAVTPSEEEIERNPRSRSAKLRGGVKVEAY